jgi:hypothetical protein
MGQLLRCLQGIAERLTSVSAALKALPRASYPAAAVSNGFQHGEGGAGWVKRLRAV